MPHFRYASNSSLTNCGNAVSVCAWVCACRFAGPRVATIYGTLYALNAVGAAIGAFTRGLLHDIAGGYRAGFIVALVILLCAALPIWVVNELRVYR